MSSATLQRIVILGGGTGGTLTANRLRRTLPADRVAITVVDRDDDHVYQPGLLFVPFGITDTKHLVRSRRHQLHAGIDYLQSDIGWVDITSNVVHLTDGSRLAYDVLVIATGATLLPGETDGLLTTGWNRNVFTFYTREGAEALAAHLASFSEGRLVVNVIDMPIKCPVAPLEFCFLADWYLRERGVRANVDITFVTPLDGAFTRPVASARLSALLGEKGITVVTDFNTGSVDAAGGRLVGYDQRVVSFDTAVVVPLHGGAEYVGRSPGLGDELNFVQADPHTLQSVASANVFAIGDAAGIPASKAGSVTHFEGDVVCNNVRNFLLGEPLTGGFDGHTNCFIETGFGKALLIDFNYDTEPLPGHFPGTIGLPLLKESRLNHIGKLLFEWFYWHTLLPGHDVPGVQSAMPVVGKRHEPELIEPSP